MRGRMFGYARVSTTDQHLDRQIEALRKYGVAERDIITDKFSGKDFNRSGYLTLKEHILRPGDTLVIKELDRLGRNYEQIKESLNFSCYFNSNRKCKCMALDFAVCLLFRKSSKLY